MKVTSKYTVGFRRKRKGLTDYRKRLKILTSKKPRLVVRKSLKNINASVVEFNTKGDVVKACAHSKQLQKLGWKYSTSNMAAAYLVGYMLGKRALKEGIEEAVFDIGLQKVAKGGKLFAVLAGAVEAGLKIPHSEDTLPNEERLKGTHIQKYAQSLKENNDAFQKQFSGYQKNSADPEKVPESIDQLKTVIDKQ